MLSLEAVLIEGSKKRSLTFIKHDSMKNTRREFIKTAATSAAAISIGGILPGFGAKSYRNIMGANDKITVACMGVNSRGLAVGTNLLHKKIAKYYMYAM